MWNETLAIEMRGPNWQPWWDLDFHAPSNQKLEKGVYFGATSYPYYNGGISLSGNGQGCHSSTGSFEILEIKYDLDGKIEELAIDFVHHCQLNSDPPQPPLRGTLRYNTYIRPSTEEEIERWLE